MDLLKAAFAECPACLPPQSPSALPACDKAEAEETCLAYILSVVFVCRDASSDPDNQAACVELELEQVEQELSSGQLAPCSSDAAKCIAIAKFAKIIASTMALICIHG